MGPRASPPKAARPAPLIISEEESRKEGPEGGLNPFGSFSPVSAEESPVTVSSAASWQSSPRPRSPSLAPQHVPPPPVQA